MNTLCNCDMHGCSRRISCFTCVKLWRTPCARCTSCQEIVKHVEATLDGTLSILKRHSPIDSLCTKCPNIHPNQLKVIKVDRLAFITIVNCLQCSKPLRASCLKVWWTKERIYYCNLLNDGDHNAWHCLLRYWHHGIIRRREDGGITALEYVQTEAPDGCSRAYVSVAFDACLHAVPGTDAVVCAR